MFPWLFKLFPPPDKNERLVSSGRHDQVIRLTMKHGLTILLSLMFILFTGLATGQAANASPNLPKLQFSKRLARPLPSTEKLRNLLRAEETNTPIQLTVDNNLPRIKTTPKTSRTKPAVEVAQEIETPLISPTVTSVIPPIKAEQATKTTRTNDLNHFAVTESKPAKTPTLSPTIVATILTLLLTIAATYGLLMIPHRRKKSQPQQQKEKPHTKQSPDTPPIKKSDASKTTAHSSNQTPTTGKQSLFSRIKTSIIKTKKTGTTQSQESSNASIDSGWLNNSQPFYGKIQKILSKGFQKGGTPNHPPATKIAMGIGKISSFFSKQRKTRERDKKQLPGANDAVPAFDINASRSVRSSGLRKKRKRGTPITTHQITNKPVSNFYSTDSKNNAAAAKQRARKMANHKKPTATPHPTPTLKEMGGEDSPQRLSGTQRKMALSAYQRTSSKKG